MPLYTSAERVRASVLWRFSCSCVLSGGGEGEAAAAALLCVTSLASCAACAGADAPGVVALSSLTSIRAPFVLRVAGLADGVVVPMDVTVSCAGL